MPLSSRTKLEKTFKQTASPHWRARLSAKTWMWKVVLGLSPVILTALLFSFQNAIRLLVSSIFFGFLFDFLFAKLHDQKTSFLSGNTLIDCLIFALLLPTFAPWWLVMIGVFFVVVIAKACFGGTGQNIFNAPLVGVASLLILFPGESSDFFRAYAFGTQDLVLSPLAWVFFPASPLLGGVSLLAVLIGAAFLVYQNLISCRLPSFFLLVVLIGFALTGENLSLVALTSGLVFFAFFVLTDAATVPIVPLSRIGFACCCAILFLLFRRAMTDVEAMTFGVLTMNSFTPLVDRYVKWPRRVASYER